MRLLFFFLLFFVVGCSTPFNSTEKIFICGDRKCKNKKEIQEYFDNNISIEVYTIVSDKKNQKNFDLVELNTLKNKFETQKKIKSIDKKKNIQKQIKERERLAKLKLKKIEEDKKINQRTKPIEGIKTKKTTKTNKIVKKNKNNKFTFIRICKNLEECDIDKISKIVMDIGKQKDFPDINN